MPQTSFMVLKFSQVVEVVANNAIPSKLQCYHHLYNVQRIDLEVNRMLYS